MKNAADLYRLLKEDPSVTRRLYAVTLGAALFMLVLVIKGPEQNGSLMTNESGDVTAIRRHSMTSSERYDVSVTAGTGDAAVKRDLTIGLRAVSQDKADDEPDQSEYMQAETDAEIDRIVNELGYSDDEIIMLPSSLSDGTPVVWRARKQKDRTGIVLVPLIYIFLAAAVIKSASDRNNNAESAAREQIMKGLPRFCNQLFLMMNAGMILSDAFEIICASYLNHGTENMSVFEKELTELISENEEGRVSTAALLSRYASRHNVKEMVRIAAILTENERRGSDVVESLSRESKYLWDERKITAREKGKMIDMKMSWPLGMLLIILIVITMAPALLSM